ncbi:hypothetical protein [Billgrantia bachuensis]|uniref:Uncharacterized protein n=1 Tax=Billgrantia bachuensis TaxID=2717286 RepID=A0ABX0PNX8_9GAMM|nr:hypothetical protein [Halomonas bachuensis]NIC04860.1 hypothetical protein [Halomonas bachuensis]
MDDLVEKLVTENKKYYECLDKCLRELFDKARDTNELQFAFSLSPEFRGLQDAGWNTAHDAIVAFDEYLEFINEGKLTSIKARVALAFYSHLSEAAGFYEIPKNMLRVAGGEQYNMWPFLGLVETHKQTGIKIAPNANKILRNLAGHAETIGLSELAACIRDAFDPDLRNGYAHADYVIWSDGIRLRKRNGGHPRLVSWKEFNARFERGINFFQMIRELTTEYMDSYSEPKIVKAAMKPGEPEFNWKIHADREKHSFSISST